MRRWFLLRSVQRLLPPDEQVVEAVFMWRRHRWMISFVLGAFFTLALVGYFSGLNGVAAQFGVGGAGAAIAATATTEYRVLVLTNRGLLLCRASRVRQVARSLLLRLPDGVDLRPVGGNLLLMDWQIGDQRFTVGKSADRAMQTINNSG